MSCLSEDVKSCGWLAPGLDTPSIKWTEFLSVSLAAEYDDDRTLQFASTLAGTRYEPLPANAFSFQRYGYDPTSPKFTLKQHRSVSGLPLSRN